MKKKYLRRKDKKFVINDRTDENKEDINPFSLTQKEIKLYHDWLQELWDSRDIDDAEDYHMFHPIVQFSPYELGMMVTAKEGDDEITLRNY